MYELNLFLPRGQSGYKQTSNQFIFAPALPVGRPTMNQFTLYFILGKDHILDYQNGYDHILFVVALCALYLLRDWKKVLILVTAFTIGHSVTLALSTLGVVSVDGALIEFLIPLTILLTAVSNLFTKEEVATAKRINVNYLFAAFFGLIHGLGFSNYLRELLGKSSNIVSPLLDRRAHV